MPPVRKQLLLISACLVCLAQAPAPSPRLRGTITSATENSLIVQTRDGGSVTVPTTPETKFAGVARSSLDQLKQGDFIGTATTGPDSAMRSYEVVIFPESMRGTGEGHYPWDGAPAAKASSMTNGTVASMHTARASSMTNGTVASRTGAGGSVVLDVTYKGGSSRIVVRPGTPVVTFVPGDASLAKAGAKVFVVTDPAMSKTAARFVAVGQDGVTPPM